MAIMIPTQPRDFAPESHEGEMFESLKKLPDNYYVFHSFKIININDNIWHENETDFVVFNKDKGILCIEAKSGNVSCEQGIWRYASGLEMRDPFEQSDTNRYKLKKYISSFPQLRNVVRHCNFLNAVWFFGLDRDSLLKLSLPSNADKNIVLTMEDVIDPVESIESIFNIKHVNNIAGLSDMDVRLLFQYVLCPTFNILPPKTLELDHKREKFNSLIKEQCNLLNYLEDQRSAVINGAAGTGKTMIALEKARRHSSKGESVLFLCFNNKLKEYLEDNYQYENVDYYTIDKFACKLCNSREADYDLLEDKLIDYLDGGFPYEHVIIDEGQDFGQDRMRIDDIFTALETLVLQTDNGTFYIFYDKLQMVQSFNMPKFIEEADCRLTLYKNCRNTRKIAETSFKPLKREPKLFDDAVSGVLPEIYFYDNNFLDVLNKIIANTLDNGIKDIQILSCTKSGNSCLDEYIDNECYNFKGKKIPFTTCRKFKGLEADKIILIDVDKESLMGNNKLFYVGTSRARFELNILTALTPNECRDIIVEWGNLVKKNDPRNTLAKILNCKNVVL